MKHILMTVLALVLATGAVNAQENSSKFELGLGAGMTTLTNYPALSLFPDATESYSNYSETIHFGYRTGKNLFGLQCRYMNFNTSAIDRDEYGQYYAFSLMVRHYEQLGERFEPYCGLSIGLSSMRNFYQLSAGSNNDDILRMGLVSEFEVGLNYKISAHTYFGISAGMNVCGTNFNNDYTLPTGIDANQKTRFGGYNLSLSYGFRF